MNASQTLFDRHLLRLRRDRITGMTKNFNFLFDEAAEMLADRLDDVRRSFPRALILGGRDGTFARLLGERGGIQTLIHADLSPCLSRHTRDTFLPQDHAPLFLAADEEVLPFAPGSFDLVICPLNLHWVNDLPGTLAQIRSILKPDGLFLANLLGGETLHELRRAWMEAELSVEKGAGIHVSPFLDLIDGASLLQRAGFALPVTDNDMLNVTYRDAVALMHDLRGMGETNAAAGRRRTVTRRETVMSVIRQYQDSASDPDGRIRASFQIITLTGWAPAPTQPQPLRPGSADIPLGSVLEIASGTKNCSTMLPKDSVP